MTLDMFLVVVAVIVGMAPIFLMKQMIAAFDHLMMWTSSFLKQDFKSYCSLEVPVDEVTFARRDGGLVTYMRLRGSTSLVGNEEFSKIGNKIDTLFAAQMKETGHDIQIVFRQDDEDSGKLIERAYSPARATCDRIGLAIDDLLDSDVETMSKFVANEACWIIANTQVTRLSAEVLKDASKAVADFVREKNLPKTGVAQNPGVIIQPLMTAHEGFVNAIRNTFDECGILIDVVDTHSAIASVRREVDANMHQDWKPSLPGDPVPANLRRGILVDDWSDMFYPPLWSQINRNDVLAFNGVDEMVKIGNMFYSTVSMDIPPQKVERFSALLTRLKKAEIPFRISWRIYSNGLDMQKFNRTMVGFLSMFPKSYNARIKGAMDYLEDLSKNANDPTMGVSIAMTTWAHDEKQLSRNVQNASRILQGWGSCDVSAKSGDAMDAFSATLPGYSTSMASKLMLFPTSALSDMLPTERPASVWEDGAVMLTSLDGKLMPFQPGSSMQSTWVSLIFAPPGKGKSALLNTLELACCTAPGLSRLPLMTVIDVGESVSGLVSLLQSGLPVNRQHEAGYFKLQMKPEYSVNVMDTQLGFRFPSGTERDFIVAFLSMLATPAGRQRPYDSTSEMLGLVVDEIYRLYSDKESPKRFERGMDPVIDEAIERSNVITDADTSWWEIVDALYGQGFIVEAAKAQRFAVPLISDVSSILNAPQVNDIYGKVEVGETKETLPDIVARMIASALREYRIFGSPTQWDISNCRVIGLDLNDVRGSGESGKKQTALMYAFAQNVATRNYYLNEDMLRDIPNKCPEMYRDFHKRRIDDVAEEIKTVSYDEFHNTGGLEGIRRIVGINIREGRKWNIQVFLASQLIDDFDSDMVENATSVYILAAENSITLEKCRNTFGLTESMLTSLERHVTRPGTFLAVYNTKVGKSVHVLKNTLSPVKYWAFTTTSEDKQVRRKLYELMPPAEARQLLAKRFSTNFKGFVEKRRSGMTLEAGDEGGSVIEAVAMELYEEWLAQKSSAAH